MTIYAKIAKVSGMLTGKLKADKTHQQGYAYLSADLILQEAGQAMAESGIVIVPGINSELSEIVEYVDQYGKNKMRFDACVYFDMAVSDGGEVTINTKWIGRGSDYTSPDKALYKAITSGHKYFIMKLLNIGVGNTDSEHDPVDDYPTGKPLKSVPNKPEPATVGDDQRKPSEAMLKKFHADGRKLYGDIWDEKRSELINSVTKGRSKKTEHLTFEECSLLIKGIEDKLAEQS